MRIWRRVTGVYSSAVIWSAIKFGSESSPKKWKRSHYPLSAMPYCYTKLQPTFHRHWSEWILIFEWTFPLNPPPFFSTFHLFDQSDLLFGLCVSSQSCFVAAVGTRQFARQWFSAPPDLFSTQLQPEQQSNQPNRVEAPAADNQKHTQWLLFTLNT